MARAVRHNLFRPAKPNGSANQLIIRITHTVTSYSQNILQEMVEFGYAENVVKSTL